ncbi:hypothetical protein BVRB_018520 [Beta vulgaris subsp. vulgaris]|uniref:Uncharacterized protein n=1 Tax=Beta vulgaris subsp. vulgaris TaxID=3555 RepID=A0A0J7YLS5_BETVV|nr:hypothetical protein BVRB_018520 [Beta vulgaris subsp. vulgaris]
MLIDSTNGDLLKSWTADIQKPEDFHLNFTTSQHVIGMSRTDEKRHLRIHCFDPLSDLDASMAVFIIHGFLLGSYILSPGNIFMVDFSDRPPPSHCLVSDHERNEKMRISSESSWMFQAYILYRKHAGGPIFCHNIINRMSGKRVCRR